MISKVAAASPFQCVLDVRARLGECPVWAVDEQVLYWVDIDAPALNRFDPATGRNHAMPMPSSIGCFARRRAGGFVVALRDGIWLAAADGTLARKVADAPYDPEHHRFNDGGCDRQGRFFAGFMNERRDADSAALVRLDADLTLTTVLGGITVSNGLAFSPDGLTMYHADTPTHIVHAYDFDPATGIPSNRRVFAQWEGETERPDGGAVDAEGCYWTAFFRGGRVLRIAPTGDVLVDIPVPALCPTMCAFGGSDLRTLYVTSARAGRDAGELERYPHSGGIFALRVDVPGLPSSDFAG
jgi:sugar lactone lactonase YvrE